MKITQEGMAIEGTDLIKLRVYSHRQIGSGNAIVAACKGHVDLNQCHSHWSIAGRVATSCNAKFKWVLGPFLTLGVNTA